MLDPKFHPTGGLFLVKPYPKSQLLRRFKLSDAVCGRIAAHLEERGLSPGIHRFAPRVEASRNDGLPFCCGRIDLV